MHRACTFSPVKAPDRIIRPRTSRRHLHCCVRGSCMDTDQRAEARVGTLLRGWHLEEVIGVGGMAAVYASRDAQGDRVAVKILHRELCTDPVVRGRFAREAELLR